MEIVVSADDFVSCGLYRIVKTKEHELVPGFGPALQKLKKKLVLICGNEDCEEEIDFTFWDSTGVNCYDCEHCGTTTHFEKTMRIEFFLDLL